MTGPDRKSVARAFGRAAPGYERADFLHAEIRARLLARLEPLRIEPATVVDLGAGPPAATADVARRFPGAGVLALDLAPAMLGAEQQGWGRVCADASRLPLADASTDLVTASMVLHWCEDPVSVLAEARRVLRYPGLFLFATLGPDTLRELRAAWSGADRFSHTLAFTDLHTLGDALVRAGFAEPVVDVETLTVTYPDVARLVADLRGVGAADLGPQRRRTLTARGRWEAMTRAYERQRTREGVLPVTVEVIYGHAWSGEAARRRPGGEFAVPLDALLRRR